MLEYLETVPIPAAVGDVARLRALDSYDILDTPPEQGFDDIVQLATQICEAPVALVSFVAADRQWFKARVAFPSCQTDLDSSVCAHALTEPDLLVVRDLTLDPRTRGNPLVTGEPYIRFYAGAPLRTSSNQTIGSLCVIDQRPRPDGLTPRQAEGLRALARQVVTQLEIRRSAIEGRKAAEARDAILLTQQAVNSARGDLDAILGAIVAGAMVAVPKAEGGVVELREGEELVYRSVGGVLAAHVGLRLPLRGSLSGSCLLSRETILCNDVLKEPRVKRDLVEALRLRSCIIVPVLRGGDAVAVLKLQSSKADVFDGDDLKLARLLAASASTALADADLRAQSELLQTVTDRVGQAVVQMNSAGQVTFANPAVETMFGWTRADVLGRSLHELIHHSHPDGRPYPAEDCPLRQALIHGRLLTNVDDVMFHKDGTPVDVLVTNAPVVVDGAVLSAVLTMTDVTERRRATERLADSEAYWRGLFERLQEGFVVGEVVRDDQGRVVDWRHLDANPAWSDIVDPRHEGMIGRSVRDVLPGIEDEWIDEPAYVVEQREPISFTRRIGPLDRWYEGRVSALGPETFVMLFLDVTDRIMAEQAVVVSGRRKAALAHLGDCLRATSDMRAMSYTAASILGQTLDACRAAYGSVNAAKETVLIESDWCAQGIASIAGVHGFRRYGSFIDDLKAGQAVFIADVRTDPRTQASTDAFAAIGIAAIYNVPIVEHDALVAVVFAHFPTPHKLSREEEDFIRSIADRTRVGIARVRAEERQAVLNGELSHRLKNTLSMVQAIANQTLRTVTDRATVAAFEDRLMALSTAHDVLLQKDWDQADLGEVLGRVLTAAGAAGRYACEGPAVTLGPRAALSTSLLIHELATNASKYGALTQAGGKIDVRWSLDGLQESEDLVLDWHEIGGPPANEPTRKGFGSRLLRMGLVGTGGSKVHYNATGLEATFRAPRTQVERA